MKKTLLKTALALAVIAALPNLMNAQQWLTTGNPTITAANYIGTHQATQSLRFGTATLGGPIANSQRMVITPAGNVGIGQRGGGIIAPTIPLNKLLVENGDIYDWTTGDGIYDRLFGLIPVTVAEADFSLIAYSNRGITNGHNFAITGYSADAAADANIGVTGIAADGFNNIGINGAARNGTNGNVGVNSTVEVTSGLGITNTNNDAFNGRVEADDADDNKGVTVEVSGDNVANHNIGFEANVSGDNSSHNYGVDVDVSCNTSTGYITGGFFEVNGASAGNVGVNTHVNGAAPYSTGFLCEIGGATGTNQIVGLDVDANGSNVTNTRGVDVEAYSGSGNNLGGHFRASNGTYTVGIIGEVITAGSGSNYGVYGSCPGASGNNGTRYAGFFNGDVFSTTNYYFSDQKLKENIREYKGALDQLSKLNIKSYTYKSKEFPGMNMPKGEHVGLMANNLKEVFPGLVKSTTYPGSLSGYEDITFDAVNTNALVPVLIQAVKELDAKSAINEKLNEEVATLKTDNESLKKDMADIKDMLDKICSNGCGDFKPASTLGGTTGSESNLFQNVPNPFSNTTVIPYTIGQGVKQAVLLVTDLNGTELKRYSTSQAGAGTFEINMGDLGTGTYIYSLFTDGKLIDTKKMMLAGK